ncbi:DUF58 domain-containing protein [Asticcacaulis sp. YBE204]|uniref:DUF58 domain-containing protein n=1 Tax=Asticcacaulis sp. YBE204 TaxID=1282363 RepID=UPI0003C3DB43|nr:DUF58 domain-containing protein [Asticcacaulis sp. YBE204]ESQ79102.1 hypothetical protein AEYBE204_11800 [Asticcacaulis sp. YBE204]
MIYPTPRLIWLMIAGVLLGSGVVFVAPALWWVAPVAMVVLILSALFEGVFAPVPSRVKLDVPLPRRIGVGRDYVFPYALSFKGPNSSSRGPAKLDVRWGITARLKTPQAGVTLMPDDNGYFKGDLPLRASSRGAAAVEAAHVRWSGWLGLGYVQRVIPLDWHLVVTPDLEGVQQDASALFSRDSVYGIRVQNQLHNGSEYHALREYDSSQDHRRIDWRSSARHLKLLSREFQTERNHHIVLAFDTGRLMGEPLLNIKKIDRALYAGLLLGYCALKVGDNVRSFAFAARPYHNAPLLSGTNAFEGLKAQLSGLDDVAEESNHTLALADLGSKIGRRSLIVLFTDFIDEISADLMVESLQRLSKKHLIVFVAFRDEVLEGLAADVPHEADDVTRAIFARRLLNRRETVYATLRRMGIEVLEATTEAMAVHVVLKYLELKREDRL